MRRKTTTVYQLKVVLDEVRPQIWRRVQVPAEIPLDQLHLVIQAAMGWTNSHLHSFKFGDFEYTMPYEPGDLEELQMEDEREVRLQELVTEPKESFGYLYDFGDSWEHIVTLEKILPPAPETKYPLCLEGKRACPPEDCGSVPGYMQLVKVLKNPAHPEYAELRTWVGRKYDPELFDVGQFDKTLRLLKRYLKYL